MLIGIFLGTIPSLATTVIAFKTERGVVVASDSLVRNITLVDGKFVKTRTNECKIQQFGATFVSGDGWLRLKTGTFDFSALVIAENIIKSTPTVSDQVSRFQHEVEAKLPEIVDAMRRSDPVEYKRLLRGAPILEIMIAGYDRDGFHYSDLSFWIDQNGEINPTDRTNWTDATAFGDRAVFGIKDHINAYTARNPRWPLLGFVGACRTFLGIEIAAHPEHTGRPISIAILDSNGAKWVEQGMCPEIEQEPIREATRPQGSPRKSADKGTTKQK